MAWTAEELQRVVLYGTCSAHGVPLAVRRTETAGPSGSVSVSVESFCAACDAAEPWPLDVLLRG